MEAPPGFEPGVEVLQTSALPLGDGAPWVEIARIVNACRDSDHTVTGWRTVLAVLLAECGGIEITDVSLSDTLTASKARRWRASTCNARPRTGVIRGPAHAAREPPTGFLMIPKHSASAAHG